jgi:hypothetical protein
MTLQIHTARITVKDMPTERVTLEMDQTSLYVARFAAEAAQLPLADWLSRVARDQGLREGLKGRPPAEPTAEDIAWQEAHLDHFFGMDEA